jgi:hypothetical protein
LIRIESIARQGAHCSTLVSVEFVRTVLKRHRQLERRSHRSTTQLAEKVLAIRVVPAIKSKQSKTHFSHPPSFDDQDDTYLQQSIESNKHTL